MIKPKTLLVLGAGASYAYGFPLGFELRKQLENHDLSEEQMAQLAEAGFDPTKLMQFAMSLRMAFSFSTIDAFLARFHDHCFGIASFRIAQILLDLEDIDSFTQPRGNDNWYYHFVNQLDKTNKDDLHSLNESEFKVITFNYDRSFEAYLHYALQHRFDDVTPPEIEAALNRIDILHIYGQLGKLEWQNNCETIPIPFAEQDKSHKHYSAAASGIRVIGQTADDNEAVTLARKFVAEAERIYILGFGFDETNVELLQLENKIEGQKRFASCYKINNGKQRRYAKEYSITFANDNFLVEQVLDELEPLS